MLTGLRVAGYRSLRDVRLPLGPLNVVTGPNGSGKSNLYRALWLLARVSDGEFARTLTKEGGFLSALWAGPKRGSKPRRMTLGFESDSVCFEMSCGFPVPSGSLFWDAPDIKEEWVWYPPRRVPTTTMLKRTNKGTWVRDQSGDMVEYPAVLAENESVLFQLREPQQFPELFALRDEIRRWRFYHGFRTDESSPLRSPQISVPTAALSHDGSDLAGALQTILEIGDGRRLRRAIEDALPGRALRIVANGDRQEGETSGSTELTVGLETAGCTRPLMARELSDGTLKYLCLVAALLSPRPPSLIALNEPEGSLHEDLLGPLAELIVDASAVTQMWVTTHSRRLVAAIEEASEVRPVGLSLVDGETVVS